MNTQNFLPLNKDCQNSTVVEADTRTLGIKNDFWIIEKGSQGMIEPFISTLVKQDGHSIFSYGVSSFGYDIRLSDKDFRVFRHIPGTIINPKNINQKNLEQIELQSDEYGEYFVLPGLSYALGVAVERLSIPRNILVVCVGKSSYARVGLIVNVTPAEPGWEGNLTLEFSNSSNADCRIYANEGIAQLLFFEGEECKTSYKDRQGKYQSQTEEVTLTKV